MSRELAWKIELIRMSALSNPDSQRILELYVPPKGIRPMDPGRGLEPGKNGVGMARNVADLVEIVFHFLGVLETDPAFLSYQEVERQKK